MGNEEQSLGERRLGAIMFTDVVGYSALSSRDEAAALRLLQQHRDLLQSTFQKFNGRVVKTMGDGFLVEFASAVEAVNCAVEAQKRMAEFNENRGTEDKALVRIGIHVGDIVHSGGDVLGDAVNVAARLQPIAEAGGICLTRQVVDQVERKVGFKMVKLGTRDLKNIRYPVEVYKVEVAPKMSQSEESRLDPHRVAILPFVNLSPDPNDKYFADGMTEELISTVSRIGELSVISRTSVMRYKDTIVPIGEIGRELSAGSVLEGSIRKAGNRVRITTQLIDAGSDRHLWAQSYDRDLTDVFAIQGDIAEKVAEALKIQLLSKEKNRIQRKGTASPEAYTLYLRGRLNWNERTEEKVRAALKNFEEAIKIDPGFAMAYSGIADCYSILSDYRLMPQAEGVALAKQYATKALELDDGLAEAHASLGLALCTVWDFRASEEEFKRALELRPNYSYASHWYAFLLWYLGRYDEAYQMETRAFELDPYSRPVWMSVGAYQLIRGEDEKAMKTFESLVALNPDYPIAYYWRAWARCWMLDYEGALADAKKAFELDGSANVKINLAGVYAASGDKESASKIVDEVLASPEAPNLGPGDIGMVLILCGREDEGFVLMKKALEMKDNSLFFFGAAPQQRKFLSDPRWKEIEVQIRALGATPWSGSAVPA